jgi:transposase
MQSTITETIGCDLGDKTSTICVLAADGKPMTREKVKTTVAAMRKFFTRPLAHVVIEVGTHSRWVSALLEDLGHRVTVANPRKVRLIGQSDSKTDWSDAELLARLGRADAALLSPVTHRSPQAHADLAVAKSRDVLVATRTKLVNHVRSTVKCFGERLASGDAANFHRKTRESLPEALKAALEPIYEVLDKISEQIRKLDETIERVAQKYPDVEIVAQPHGIGTLTALVYVLTLEDKTRFRRSRSAGAFLGLRPKARQSGEDDPQLRITKAGDPFVRRLLVIAANKILGPTGADSDLRRWGLKLAERGGKNARKRAKVAVARKLAVLMHRLWVTGEVYEPIGYGKRQAA